MGRLFGRNQRQTKETDIVMTMTPHIVRVLDLTEEDLRAFRMARDVSAIGGGGDLRSPVEELLRGITQPRDPGLEPAPVQGTVPGGSPIVQPGVPLGSVPTVPTPIRPPCTKPPCNQ